VLETDRPQHYRSAACVIAQQYSSATLVSLRCHSCQEKLGPFFKKNVFISIFSLFERKLRKFEIGSLEIVCVRECL